MNLSLTEAWRLVLMQALTLSLTKALTLLLTKQLTLSLFLGYLRCNEVGVLVNRAALNFGVPVSC